MICDVTHSHYITFHHSLDTSFSPLLCSLVFEKDHNYRSCTDVVVLDIACAGSKTTVLKETDRETKHIIETLVAFENGIARSVAID
jgi:hypothetical protein